MNKNLPSWAQTGKLRFARIDGGPIEAAKGIPSGWLICFIPTASIPVVTSIIRKLYL